MNHHELTQRNLNIGRSKIQILVLVIWILVLAVSGLAQETSREKDQSEIVPASEDSKSQPESKDEDRRRSSLRVAVARSTVQPASDASKFAVFFEAGAVFAHGDFATFFDPGFSLNTGLEYMITPQFSAEGTLGYHRFGTFFGGHADLYQVSGNGKFYLVDESSNIRPFVNGGVGAYVTNSATTHFGGNVGGGILYELTPKFGIQGAYNFHAVNVGSGLRFSTIQGGVRFRF